MKIRGGVTGVVAASVVSVLVAACGGSDSKVSIQKLQQTADKVIAAPGGSCPLGFDVDAALKKAGIAGTATPGAGTSSDTPAVDADSATNADDDAPLKLRGGGVITCHYTLSGGGFLQAAVAGVRDGAVINLMAPLLQHDAELKMTDLQAFVTRKLETGEAVLTPDKAMVAVSKLGASGGDALLEVTTEAADHDAEHGPIVGEPLRKLTEALGKQVRV